MPDRPHFAHPFHGTLRPGRTHRLPAVDVTVLFADVVASTDLVQRFGDRGAYSLIRRFCQLVRDTAEAVEGEPLELRGDGALIAFASPDAALACAREIQRTCDREGAIAVRMGAHAGRVLQLDRGYFGQALILAARLADRAGAGEILVSADVVRGLDEAGRAALEACGSLEVKGFPEPVAVYRVPWRDDTGANDSSV